MQPWWQIYSIRPSAHAAAQARLSDSARSKTVGARYGISAKAVRDIWQRLTWTAATEPLWTDEVPPRHSFPFPGLLSRSIPAAYESARLP